MDHTYFLYFLIYIKDRISYKIIPKETYTLFLVYLVHLYIEGTARFESLS